MKLKRWPELQANDGQLGRPSEKYSRILREADRRCRSCSRNNGHIFRRLIAGAGSGAALAVGLATTGASTITGCTTHQCDGSTVCIDSRGNMKPVTRASDCTPVITGGTKIPFYNTQVEVVAGGLQWTSSALRGPWLDFPGQRTYIINLPPELAGQDGLVISSSVSSDNFDSSDDADTQHANWTQGSGQLVEFTNAGTSQQLSVFNDTCVDYGLRLVVEGVDTEAGPPQSPAAPDASDAPVEASAALPDAETTE